MKGQEKGKEKRIVNYLPKEKKKFTPVVLEKSIKLYMNFRYFHES